MSVSAASVERARQGDQAAFEIVARACQQQAVYAALSRLGDLQLAEDVAQEALVEAYTRLAQLRSPNAFPLWLSRIVRTKARTLRPSHPELPLIETCPVVDPGRTAEELLERELICQGVRNSLLRLPEHQRGVVKFYYFERLRQADICEALGLPPTTVAKRLHDARAALRRIIGSPERLADVRNDRTSIRKEKKMGIEESKTLIRRWVELNKEGKQEEAIRELVSPDVAHHANRESGREAYEAAINHFKSVGVTYHVGDMIAEGDRIAVWWVRDEGPPADTPNVMTHIYRVADGKIVESINTTLYYG